MKIINWWKTKPYWLKGAVIGIVVAISMYVLFLVGNEMCASGTISGLGVDQCYGTVNFMIDLTLVFDFLSLIACNGVCKGWGGIVHIVTLWPSFFIIGAVLGWIYGRQGKI